MLALVKLHLADKCLNEATLLVDQQMQGLLQAEAPPAILEKILLALLAAAAQQDPDDVSPVRHLCARFSQCCPASDAARFQAAQLQLLGKCSRLENNAGQKVLLTIQSKS